MHLLGCSFVSRAKGVEEPRHDLSSCRGMVVQESHLSDAQLVPNLYNRATPDAVLACGA